MRNRLQTAFAIIAGVLIIGAAALGGAFMQPGVDDLDDAAGHYVEGAEGQVALGVGLAVGAAAYYTYDNYIKSSPNTKEEELAKTDALETHKEIYDQASIQKENNELTNTAYSNYLQDTESIALMEGKNAYIRALENGSAESVARNKATQAVADYYSVKQQNIIAAWNTTMAVGESISTVAANTTNLTADNVIYGHGNINDDKMVFSDWNQTREMTLVNASTQPVAAVMMTEVSTGYGGVRTFQQETDGDFTEYLTNLYVAPPNSNYDRLTMVNTGTFKSRWTEIEQQNSDVQAALDTFVNNTYDSYQQGEINTSDLVDPYLGAREYSPETSNTWALRTLSAMGMDTPQNLSNIGRMNVTASGDTYTGVLMSDGTPSGGYVVGNSYNASNITGAQFVATDDGGAVKLEGNFTLDSAEGYAAGESVEYTNISYQTANTTEFKELQSQLDQLTAEINARQQEQRSAGGGGILPDFGAGGAIPGAVILAGAAAFLLTRD